MQSAIYLAGVSRYHSYLNSAKNILQSYDGGTSFASFIKKYFLADKKFGSKDRKQVSNLCYCFFRMGKIGMDTTLEEKIVTALFLCSDKPNEISCCIQTRMDDKCDLPVDQKLFIIN